MLAVSICPPYMDNSELLLVLVGNSAGALLLDICMK